MATLSQQDEALNGLMGAQQWKEAYKLCEKKLKKSKGSDYLLVRKITILLCWPDHREQAYKELDTLLVRKPPVSDIETLLYMDNMGERLPDAGEELGTRLSQMWQNAAASRPEDKKLHEVWYRTKFEAGRMDAAKQEKQSAKKSAKKTEEKTEGKTVVESTERDIDKLEDLLLLVRIYRAQGKYDETIKVISHFQEKRQSTTWDVVKQLIELYELTHQWKKLYGYCTSLLDEALEPSKTPNSGFGKLGDDWKVWQGLLKANEEINHEMTTEATEGLTYRFFQANSKSRNARLALLSLYAAEVKAQHKPRSILCTALLEYFYDFSSTFICFQDLKRYLPLLYRDEQEEFLVLASNHTQQSRATPEEPEDSISEQIKWITSEVNVLKFEYNIVVTKNLQQVDLLIAFINNCLRLYKVSLLFDLDQPVTDRRPGDDAGILAAMALVHLTYWHSGHDNALLRAILILELLLLHSKHNYDALLILVRLYVVYGAGSLALERFHRLSIKNTQHASLSWLLYTRISTIHPYPSSFPTPDGQGVMTIDPAENICFAHNWHQIVQDLSLKATRAMQNQGQWSMILDTLETEDHIVKSFSKCHLFIEMKRVARFRANSHDTSDQTMRIPPQTHDTRDRSAFPDFEGVDSTFADLLLSIRKFSDLNDKWLVSELLLTILWDMLKNNDHSPVLMAQWNTLRERSKHLPETHTPEELNVYLFVKALYQVHDIYTKQGASSPSDDDRDFICRIVKSFDEWLSTNVEKVEKATQSGQIAPLAMTADLKIPHWDFFNVRYRFLELCQVVKLTLEYAVTQNRKQGSKAPADPEWLETKVTNILEGYKKIATIMHRSAGKLQASLQGPAALQEIDHAIIGRIEDARDLIGWELQKFNSDAMTKICRDIQGSWIEGLQGIIQTKFS